VTDFLLITFLSGAFTFALLAWTQATAATLRDKPWPSLWRCVPPSLVAAGLGGAIAQLILRSCAP
jgi:hypothetical protein